MSKESEETLFRHGNNLIAANYTEKGKAIYNSHSGLASETIEFNYGYIDPKDYLDLFKQYYGISLKNGWTDNRVIYRKTDNPVIEEDNLTFTPNTNNNTVEIEIGFIANISRSKCKIPLFDDRGRTSNFLILGEGDENKQFKSGILTVAIASYIQNSASVSNVFVYSESDFLKSSFLKMENIQKSNKLDDLHSWISSVYNDGINKSENRNLLILDGIDYLEELSDLDDDNDDGWGNSTNTLSALKKLAFILNKGKTRNMSVIIYSERRKSVLNIFGSDILEDFNYALALKGGDNRVNESDWENHELEENIGLLNNLKEKESNKVNLIKIK